MFYGYLLYKADEISTPYFSYIPIAVVRECGYGIQIMKCRVFKQSLINKMSTIQVNAPIKYDVRSVKRGVYKYNNIISIEECSFLECSDCKYPYTDLNSSECLGCKNEKVQQIDGEYIIKVFHTFDE